MKPTEIYGLSRNRDKKGKVVKRNLNPYVNCLHTLVGSSRENMEVYVMEEMRKDIALEPMCSVHPNSHKFEFNPETSVKSIAPALRATDYKAPHCVYEPRVRIRKLTPRECFRLMGVDDKDIDTLQSAGVSNSQQYKLAGNSIVVDVLYHLFRKVFCETENEQQQMTLF